MLSSLVLSAWFCPHELLSTLPHWHHIHALDTCAHTWHPRQAHIRIIVPNRLCGGCARRLSHSHGGVSSIIAARAQSRAYFSDIPVKIIETSPLQPACHGMQLPPGCEALPYGLLLWSMLPSLKLLTDLALLTPLMWPPPLLLLLPPSDNDAGCTNEPLDLLPPPPYMVPQMEACTNRRQVVNRDTDSPTTPNTTPCV